MVTSIVTMIGCTCMTGQFLASLTVYRVLPVSGTAHCANMYPARAEDSPDLVAARVQIGELIGQWLQED